MTDLIDRQVALSFPFANGQYDHEHADTHFIFGCEMYREWLETLPSAEPERKTGKWIKCPDNTGWIVYECSICGLHRGTDGYNFCPNCGADMREEE